MILSDAVQVCEPEPTGELDVSRLERLSRFGNHLSNLDNLCNDTDILGGRRDMYLRTAHNRMRSAFDVERLAVLKEIGTLPKTLLNKNDPLSLAATCPRIKISEVKRVADKLSFVFIPYNYLKGGSADNKEQVVIDAFLKKLPEIYTPYVLCPVALYDVNAHVMAEDMPIYAGELNRQAFLALSLSIPQFRAVYGEIRDLQKRVDGHDERLNKVSKEIKNLALRVEELSAEMKQIQKKRLIEEAKTKAMAEQLRRLEAERMWRLEPLLVGVPLTKESVDLSIDHSCVVGPCWGPDFDDIVFEVLDLKKIAGQRQRLAASAQNWAMN